MDLGKKIKHGHEDAPIEAPIFVMPKSEPVSVPGFAPDFTPVPVRAPTPVQTAQR